MDIFMKIPEDQVICINRVPNQVDIWIHLNEIWGYIEERYTYIAIEVYLQIPTIEKIDVIHYIQTITETDITQSFKVNEIVDEKVYMTIGYPGTLDTEHPEREVKSKAKVTGYNIKTYV